MARRPHPFIDMRRGFRLACFLHQLIALRSQGQLLRFLARLGCSPPQPFVEGKSVLAPMPRDRHEPLLAYEFPKRRAIRSIGR
jgi:hypothetical protein